jgi:hypothetical protein
MMTEAERARKAERKAAEKARLAKLVTRWVRRSHGVLLRREARELVERLRGFGGSDFIGWRKPGDFAEHAVEAMAWRRRKGLAPVGGDFARNCKDKFFNYGPSGGAGMWPGDRLVWDPERVVFEWLPEDEPRRKGAWVVERGNG